MGKVFHVDHQIANKNVEDSITECTKVVKYSDINSENRLFGGQLMSWIDEVAGCSKTFRQSRCHSGCRQHAV